jgi:hypothetical protein
MSAALGLMVCGFLFSVSFLEADAAPQGSAIHQTPQMAVAPLVRAGSSQRDCGRKLLFGRPFSVRIVGARTRCGEVRHIVAPGCRIRLNQRWSCVPLRGEKPFLFWFLSDEIFAPRFTKVIVFERYPCSEAHVTPSLFAHHSENFPSRRQMLADDLIRCRMLHGLTLQQVEEMIGPPDERGNERSRTYLDYILGPERESIVRIDPEFLSVEIENGKVKEIYIFQG